MEELKSYIWAYEEAIEELSRRLLYRSIELESLKKEASEQLQRQNEHIISLIELIGLAYQQRDDAKDQLHRLLNILKSTPQLNPILPHNYSQSPLLMPEYANSSIIESNSVSETYNAVPSPDFSTVNVVDSRQLGTFVTQQPLVQDCNGSNPSGLVSLGVPKIDRATAVIDSLVMGKALPQKGELMQAVMDAGPLLQTLIVAGPAPRLSNSPSIQPFKNPSSSTFNKPSKIYSASMLSNFSSPNSSLN